MKHAVVTGATGLVGNRLVLALRHAGWRVVAGVRRPVRSRDDGITSVAGDLTDADFFTRLKSAAGNVDAFFHLGAALPVGLPAKSSAELLQVNAVSTARLLEESAGWGDFALVFASSISVIGKPLVLPVTEEHPLQPRHIYSVSKLAAELACELERVAHHRRITSLRFTSIYGTGMPAATILPRFAEQARRGEDLCWLGEGTRTQNFLNAEDAARACLQAAGATTHGVFNIGGTRAIGMRALAELTHRLTPGCQSALKSLDQPDAQADYFWEIDLTKARRELGYEPVVPLDQGLEKYIQSLAAGHDAPRWWSPA